MRGQRCPLSACARRDPRIAITLTRARTVGGSRAADIGQSSSVDNVPRGTPAKTHADEGEREAGREPEGRVPEPSCNLRARDQDAVRYRMIDLVRSPWA